MCDNFIRLITGCKGNSYMLFCFPENFSLETSRVKGKQKKLFPKGPVIKCFVIEIEFGVKL